ncbi:MAG: DUF86 domain-containing protein [Gammaproteobacteria bacterium]|nr:DUF86 domain-containing protein [Gammaproteobacteria bacterium]
MRDAFKTIAKYAKHGEETFFKNQMLQDAICRQLEIVGEASNKISAGTRKMLSDMPWKELIENRNFLTHVYFRQSLHKIWDSATNLIPKAEATLNLHKATIALLERRAKGTSLER